MDKYMELSRRLFAVASLVTPGRKVADIGCDHGYISIYLGANHICPVIIAMDVNEGPLEHAKRNIKKYGLDNFIDVRLSDGTNALHQDEVDAWLISGMGGRLMNRILKDGFSRIGFVEELILQPQSEVEMVRAFLREQEYTIVDEDFVIEDGKNYPVIKALYHGKEPVKKDIFTLAQEDLFGPVLLQKKPQDFVTYIKDKIVKTKEILLKITQEEKKAEMQNLLDELLYVEKNL